MKLARFATVAALAAAAMISGTAAQAQDKVSLRLNWYLGGLHVPFYYGKDKGYLRGRGHRPHDQRGPRLGEHRAGGRRRLRHVRARRFVVGDPDRRQGRGHQERDVAAQHDRVLGGVAGGSADQDAEGPRGQEGCGDARRSARPAAAGGVQGQQRGLRQDQHDPGRPGGQGGDRAREEDRRAAGRRRRPVLPDQVQGRQPGRDALRRLRREHRRA